VQKLTFFLLSVFLFCLCLCTNKKGRGDDQRNRTGLTDPTGNVMDADSIKPPIVIKLSDVKKPKVTAVPSQNAAVRSEKNSVGLGSTISLGPPKITLSPQGGLAGGLAHFTNFTTENGLALDGILCSVLDESGNLWFGTSGGGVSRYDGRTFTNYDAAHGLVNNLVRCIKIDKKGTLWFGTDGGGVSSYDGKIFTNYSTSNGLPDNVVLCIEEDKNQNLWFGTGAGVSQFNGKTFTNYSVDDGLAGNVVLSIVEDKTGNLWFGTDGGGVSLYVTDKSKTSGKQDSHKKFTNYTTAQGLANDVVMSMIEDRTGNLWFATYGGGVSRYDGKKFSNYTSAQGLASNVVLSILEDKSGQLWFGTSGGGVSHFENTIPTIGCSGESLGKFTNYTSAQGLANNVVSCISQDKTGNLWFGTYGGGVSRYDGKSFTNYTSSQGLPNNVVWTIAEDKRGSLWFGTDGGGVSRYETDVSEPCDVRNSQGKYTQYTSAQGLANNVVLSIKEDKNGVLWFGTYGGGVSRFDGHTFTNYNTAQGLANNVVRSICEDHLGSLWFGTYGGGLSRFDGESFTNYGSAQGLANNVVMSIIEDKAGNLWIGTSGGGVSRFVINQTKGSQSNILTSRFTNYTKAQGLGNNVVMSICEDHAGNLWFGTYGGGVSRYDGKTFKNFTTVQGLPDDIITQVVADKNGANLTIGTNFGIAVGVAFTPKLQYRSIKKEVSFQNNLSNNELSSYYDLVLEVYNSATGYPIKDVNTGQNCMLQDSIGVYWAGTGSDATALVRIDFESLNRNPKRPVPFLTKIKINEENICYYSLNSKTQGITEKAQADSLIQATQEIISYGKPLSASDRDSLREQFEGIEFDGITKFYAIPQNLELSYDRRNVSFEFNAVELSRSHLLNFQYMLEGYDDTWSPVLKKREATFGNINEGTYTFKLKAQYAGPDGNKAWSDVFSYTFRVLPPWYRTWWMYSVYGIFLVGAVVIVVWWNGRKLRARANLLLQKVDEATHEIKEQKYLIEEKHKEITDSINYAERIQRSFLATKEILDANLNDYFVIFKPKDIVSGDFYWAGKLNNGNFAFVTADSTGHGVPGAIMSLLNITSLEKAIETSNEPADMLNITRNIIIERLKKDGSPDGGKDGMDASLTVYDFKNRKLFISAANIPVWIVREAVGTSNKEIIEIKADKMPIGKHEKDNLSFTQKEFDLNNGDVIFTLSDGYADQFGGENGKKFMSKNLRELLAKNSHLPMHEQKQILESTFVKWLGNKEQVDDITLIGVRV
jgi:ligand-binding sensor domain-containing protein/serine phosphatase RsbU (regulator of sigma subunit)